MIPKLLRSYFVASVFFAAFLPGSVRADDSLIKNGDFTSGSSGLDGWIFNKLENTVADATSETIEGNKHALHIKVPQAGAKRYFVQLIRSGLHLQADKTYHLRFRARSLPGCEIVLLAATYHGKYSELWRQEHVALKPEWADYTSDFKVSTTEDSAQIIFSGFAAQAGDYWLTDISLEEGQ